ncbi:MAG: hypothetical protein LJE91_07160 [Gammaproteobacteria bacterium]|nr:hypothetical protein [Gammaproteobacteria bacterium]
MAPDSAIDNGQTVTVEATFEILHTGKTHTDNDIMIHLQPANVLFLGDAVGYHRILDMDDGSFPRERGGYRRRAGQARQPELSEDRGGRILTVEVALSRFAFHSGNQTGARGRRSSSKVS